MSWKKKRICLTETCPTLKGSCIISTSHAVHYCYVIFRSINLFFLLTDKHADTYLIWRCICWWKRRWVWWWSWWKSFHRSPRAIGIYAAVPWELFFNKNNNNDKKKKNIRFTQKLHTSHFCCCFFAQHWKEDHSQLPPFLLWLSPEVILNITFAFWE